MDKTTLINILLSLADEELRMFAKWIVSHIPLSLYGFLETPIAARILGPLSAWVESRGDNKAPLVKALYEKLSDFIDAAAHELFTRRGERAGPATQWRSGFETEAPTFLGPALAAHGAGMSAKDFVRNAWNMFDETITSLDQWLAPRLKAHADRLETHPAVQKHLAPHKR